MATTKQKQARLTTALVRRFLITLEGKKGCNLRYRKKGDPSSLTWKCAGGTDKSISKRILRGLGLDDKDTTRVLAVASKHGGHCDCEILFNARAALRKKSWK